MLSVWHVTHLPVRVTGEQRIRRLVEDVVVSWEEPRVEGFILSPRLFSSWYLPADAERMVVSEMGIETLRWDGVERRTRRWTKHHEGVLGRLRNRPVVDQEGRLCGRLKDLIFSEHTFRVEALVVSRGILGDLLSGTVLVPTGDVTEIGGEAIKIYAHGEPFSMR